MEKKKKCNSHNDFSPDCHSHETRTGLRHQRFQGSELVTDSKRVPNTWFPAHIKSEISASAAASTRGHPRNKNMSYHTHTVGGKVSHAGSSSCTKHIPGKCPTRFPVSKYRHSPELAKKRKKKRKIKR